MGSEPSPGEEGAPEARKSVSAANELAALLGLEGPFATPAAAPAPAAPAPAAAQEAPAAPHGAANDGAAPPLSSGGSASQEPAAAEEAAAAPAADGAAPAAGASAAAAREPEGEERPEGASLSASAPTFEMPLASRLPPSHKALLRGGYHNPCTGELIPYYIGTLKSYSMQKGFGFLECEQSFMEYGTDVFIHKNLVPNPWNVGQPLEFAVMANTRGQPQAIDVQWLPLLPNAAKRRAKGRTAESTGGTGDSAGSARDAGFATAPGQAQRRIGKLKSFSPAQGYGFISCEDVFTEFQRDTYFDKSQLPKNPYRLGQTVEFSVTANPRGQPQARGIDWDPVPMLAPEHPGTMMTQQDVTRNISHEASDKLRRLLKLHHERQLETLIITAIDFQGVSGAAPAGSTGRDGIDYVTYVLDRLGAPQEVAKCLKDFVKMLLLLMLTRMLKGQLQQNHTNRLLQWFEVLAKTIDIAGSQEVSGHFPDVWGQINAYLEQAVRTNSWLREEQQSSLLQESLACLRNKLNAKQSRPPPGLPEPSSGLPKGKGAPPS